MEFVNQMVMLTFNRHGKPRSNGAQFWKCVICSERPAYLYS